MIYYICIKAILKGMKKYMERGRRYSGGRKLNMKKVFAVIIAFCSNYNDLL